MKIDLSQFRQTFFEEAAEHIADMEGALLTLEDTPGDLELLNRIFRAAHSIKGSGGSLGFDGIARFTHVLESLLDRMRSGETAVTPPLADLLLRATDVLQSLLAAAQSESAEPEAAAVLHAELERALAGTTVDAAAPATTPSVAPPAAAAAASAVWQIRFDPGADILRQGLDPVLLIRDLADLGKLLDVRLLDDALPGLVELDPESCRLAWELRLETSRGEREMRDVFAFVDGARLDLFQEGAAGGNAAAAAATPAADGAPARGGKAAGVEASSIRVASTKVDKLIDLVGEVVIAQSMIIQEVRHFSPARLPALQAAVEEMQRNTRELQERVMGIRMLPIGSLFSRFSRIVRDLCISLGKDADLVLSGEETELDKSVLERLGDPMTHLVRNAIDHGMETTEQRVAAGKPPRGTIALRAFHEGGNVVMEIEDDGRGLDLGRIRAKALASGIIAAGDEISDDELQALIFHPGFSTAEKVTDLSGRGVGLDVVKRNVVALNGSVSVRSRPGQGTTFLVKLPLTLAILDGLTLSVGEQTFIVPLASIIESRLPKEGEVKTVIGRGEVMLVRGEALPLLRVHAIFGIEPRSSDPCQGLVVIVESGKRKIALFVDELLGQSQVVIKNLEANFRRVDGVMGATIMGDGRVALIVDIAGLVRMTGRGAAKDRALVGAGGPA